MVNSSNAPVDNDLLAEVARNGLSTENFYSTLMDQMGGKKIFSEVTGLLGQDMAQLGANAAVKPTIIAVAHSLAKSPVLKNKLPEIDEQKISQVVDGAVFMLGPTLETKRTIGYDVKVRNTINDSLREYVKEGGEGIARSSFLNSKPENKVLASVENRIQDQFKENLVNVGISVLSSTTMLMAQRQDKNAVKESIESHRNSKKADFLDGAAEYEVLMSQAADGVVIESPETKPLKKAYDAVQKIDADADKALKEKTKDPRMLSKSLFVNNTVEVGSDNVPVYGDKYINTTTATVAAGAVGLSYVKELAKQVVSPGRDTVIAFDMIQYLNDYVQRNDVSDGKIDIGKFKAEHKNHQFHTIGNESSVPIASVVEEIFRQHVRDQGADGIGSRYDDELKQASQYIADAISGKNFDLMSGATLDPIALIDLVGNGQIVAHDGMKVAGSRSVMEAINAARSSHPFEQEVDIKEYMVELSQSPAELMGIMVDLDPRFRDYMMALIPSDVQQEKLGLKRDDILAAKTRAENNLIDVTKEVIADFMADEKGLKEDNLTKHQVKMVHDASKHIEQGDDAQLLKMLRDNSIEGLGFAILSHEDYWKDKALQTSLAASDANSPIVIPDNIVKDSASVSKMQGEEVSAAVGK